MQISILYVNLVKRYAMHCTTTMRFVVLWLPSSSERQHRGDSLNSRGFRNAISQETLQTLLSNKELFLREQNGCFVSYFETIMHTDTQTVTHHRSVYIPESSFLTVQYFPFNFVSFLIDSVHAEHKAKEIKTSQNLKKKKQVIVAYFLGTRKHNSAARNWKPKKKSWKSSRNDSLDEFSISQVISLYSLYQ